MSERSDSEGRRKMGSGLVGVKEENRWEVG